MDNATHREEPGYDAFAQETFAPFFPLYANDIVMRTGISTGHLLDLGCGGGLLGFALMDRGNFEDVTFCDISPHAIEQARERAAQRNYHASECHFEQGDACDLSCFSDDSFSLVVSRGSMQFWSDLDTAVHEIHRVLAKNGCAYLGGGIGTNYRLTKRIEEMMPQRRRAHGMGEGCHEATQRKASRDEQCKHMIDLFAELGCSYAVMNSKGQGGWYIMRKDDHLPW